MFFRKTMKKVLRNYKMRGKVTTTKKEREKRRRKKMMNKEIGRKK